MYLVRVNGGYLKICFTLIFEINYGGQVTYVSHFVILKIGFHCSNRQPN